MQRCTLSFGSQPGAFIPDALFGQNLEVTRKTMFGGLSAQLINNRKFHAAAGEPFARGWSPVGNCSILDEETRRTPMLKLSSAASGLVQTDGPFSLRAGCQYDWRLRVRGECRANITLKIGDIATDISVHLEMIGRPVTLSGSLGGEATGKLSISATGEGTLLIECVSLLPSDSIINGLRPDVIMKLRALKPAALRFPGGCYAEFADWKQGFLDPDERRVIEVRGMDFLLGATWHTDPQDMSLDDFVEVCRLVGAQPHYTVRMTDATPEDAAALVEYANGSVATPWGFMRAARGHAAPYNIKRWYIGNEIYPFVPGMKDPIVAAQRTIELARSMKQADPTIELVPSNWALSEWNAAFMAEIEKLGGAELLSLASYHQYLLDIMQNFGDALVVEHPEDPITPEQIELCLRAPVERILPRMRQVRQELLSAGPGVGALPVIMDEWNFYWKRPGHPVLAMYMMGIFNVLVRHADENGIREAMFFHPVNEGMLRVTPEHTVFEDGARAWLLARPHGGRAALPLEGLPADSALDAAATTDGDSVYITLVNRSLSRPVALTLPRMAQAALIQTECWATETPEVNAMRPASMKMHTLQIENGGTVVLPPASIAGIWLR